MAFPNARISLTSSKDFFNITHRLPQNVWLVKAFHYYLHHTDWGLWVLAVIMKYDLRQKSYKAYFMVYLDWILFSRILFISICNILLTLTFLDLLWRSQPSRNTAIILGWSLRPIADLATTFDGHDQSGCFLSFQIKKELHFCEFQWDIRPTITY